MCHIRHFWHIWHGATHMNMRAPLVLALTAGIPAAAPAQEAFYVSYSWKEVLAGTTTPSPLVNTRVDPGEGALIRVSVEARFNGSSAIGQTTVYTTPLPGGIGTVRGLGSAVYDLIGEHNGTFADGAWSHLSGPLSGGPFTTRFAGTPQPGGRSVHGFGGAQFVIPGQTASGLNSNVQVFQGVWTPANPFQLTNISFVARASIQVPTGEQNSVLFAYGLGTDPGSGSSYDLLASKDLPTAFGFGVDIIFIPAPSVGGLALVGATGLGRRRRSTAATQPAPA